MTPLTEKLKRKLEFERKNVNNMGITALERYYIGAEFENARLRPILDQLILCVAALEPARNWQADDEPMKSLLLKAQQALTQLEKVLE